MDINNPQHPLNINNPGREEYLKAIQDTIERPVPDTLEKLIALKNKEDDSQFIEIRLIDATQEAINKAQESLANRVMSRAQRERLKEDFDNMKINLALMKEDKDKATQLKVLRKYQKTTVPTRNIEHNTQDALVARERLGRHKEYPIKPSEAFPREVFDGNWNEERFNEGEFVKRVPSYKGVTYEYLKDRDIWRLKRNYHTTNSFVEFDASKYRIDQCFDLFFNKQ